MTQRLLGPTGSRKRRRFLFVPVVLVAVLATFWIAGAQAVHDDGFFELDRDALSGAAAGDDWQNIYLETGSADATTGIVADGIGPSIFTGGGSKDDLNTTGWKHKSGQTPDKDELLDAYAARYGDNLYFGADRYDASGDAVMGFWFFQEEIVPQADGSFGPGEHKDGDVLVLSDFTNGGGAVTIRVFEWNGPGGDIPGSGAINGTLDLLAGTLAQTADCVGPPSVPNADPYCATVNTANQASPWPYQPKNNPASIFPAGHFFEGGVDLGFLELGDQCFASFLAESRASTSVDSVLKDFVGGQFERCESTLTTTPSNASGTAVSTIEKGGTIYDYALVEGSGSNANPTGTVAFSVCSPSQLDDASPTDDPNTCDVGGTAAGTNSVTPIANTSNSEALSNAVVANVTGKWCFRGHYSGDDNYPPADDARATECFNVVDAKIGVSPLTATNEVGTTHVVTATVQQDTGSGFVAAPDGTTVTFSLLNNNAAAVFTPTGVNTCTTTGGSCTISITTTTTGTVDIHATTSFSISGLTVTRSTDGLGNNSADAKKRYVDAQIDLSPLTDTNGITENHTITATVQQDDGLAANTGGGDAVAGFGPAPNGTSVTFSFSQNTIGATFVGGVNTCTTTAGSCSIDITSSTAGTVKVHATTTFDIGPAPLEQVTRSTDGLGNNSGDAEKIFVAGSLTWLKNDNAGNRLAGATFQVCRTADRFGAAVTGECVTVVDDSAPDTDADDGEFKIEDKKLGHYTVEETAAPPGFEAGGGTKSADLTLVAPNASITIAFVNARPVLKITGFGYTNAATGTPTAGVVSGTATYTVDLHNYGGASAPLTNSSIVASVTGGGSGTLSCNGDPPAPALTKAITGTVTAGGDLGPVTLVCTYSGMSDGAVITATLNVKYTLNGLERSASGSPATVSFTVQGD